MRISIIGFTGAPAACRVVHELAGVDRLTSTIEMAVACLKADIVATILDVAVAA